MLISCEVRWTGDDRGGGGGGSRWPAGDEAIAGEGQEDGRGWEWDGLSVGRSWLTWSSCSQAEGARGRAGCFGLNSHLQVLPLPPPSNTAACPFFSPPPRLAEGTQLASTAPCAQLSAAALSSEHTHSRADALVSVPLPPTPGPRLAPTTFRSRKAVLGRVASPVTARGPGCVRRRRPIRVRLPPPLSRSCSPPPPPPRRLPSPSLPVFLAQPQHLPSLLAMKFTLATLVLAASSAVAFTITTPEGWTTTGPCPPSPLAFLPPLPPVRASPSLLASQADRSPARRPARSQHDRVLVRPSLPVASSPRPPSLTLPPPPLAQTAPSPPTPQPSPSRSRLSPTRTTRPSSPSRTTLPRRRSRSPPPATTSSPPATTTSSVGPPPCPLAASPFSVNGP